MVVDDGEWEIVDDAPEDAPLPVLTVRHLLSEDQMVAKDPYFVAMDESQVEEAIYEFFQDGGKTSAFVRAWKDALAGVQRWDVPASATLWAAAAFKPHLATDDAADTATTVEGILANRSRQQRNIEWSKFYCPFEASRPMAPPSHAFDKKTTILMADGAPMTLLPDDDARLPLIGFMVSEAAARRGVGERHTTLGDRLAPAPAPTEAAEPRMFSADEASRWRPVVQAAAMAHRKQSFADWLENVDALEDVHAMATSMAARGLDWDALTPHELDALIQRLVALEAKLPRTARRSSGAVPATKKVKTQEGQWAALLAALRRVSPSKLPTARWQRAREHAPAKLDVVGLPAPLNPSTLFGAIEAAGGDPAQVLAILQSYETDARQATDKAFLDATAWWDAVADDGGAYDAHIDAVEAAAAAMDRCAASATLTNAYNHMALDVDMKQVKKGRNLEHYSGRLAYMEDMAVPAAAREPDDDAEADWATLFDNEEESSAAALIPPPEAAAGLPEATEATPGQAEVLGVVLPLLEAVASRTRLPLERAALVAGLLPHTHWASRRTMLVQGLPNVPEEDIGALLANDAFADGYSQDQQRHLVRRVTKEVQTAFKKVVYDVLDAAFAWWATALQETFVEHRLLDYVPPEGLCTAFWGFHGPPMTNTQGRGVLMYLLCSFQTGIGGGDGAFLDYLGKGTPEGRVATIAGVANALFPDRVARIKAAYADLIPFLMKQKAVLKAEQDVLKRMFVDGRSLYKYVGALLQLPKWTAIQQTTMRGISARGCCAQALDANYKAYGNWDTKVLKPLAKEMAAFQRAGTAVNAGAAIWGVWRSAMTDVAAKPCRLPKTDVAPAPPSPASFDDIHPALAPWARAGANAVKMRLQLLAKQTKTSGATWAAKFDLATADELAALASRLFATQHGIVPPGTLAHWMSARDALLTARRAIAPQDEQAILADMKNIVSCIAILPRESSADGTAWSLPEGPSDAETAHSDAAALLNAFMDQTDRTAAYLQDHINELRERQKAKLLRELNSRDADLRALLTQMGRIGLVKLSDPSLPGKRGDADADGGEFGGIGGIRLADGDGDGDGDNEEGGGDEEGYTDVYHGVDDDGHEDALE